MRAIHWHTWNKYEKHISEKNIEILDLKLKAFGLQIWITLHFTGFWLEIFWATIYILDYVTIVGTPLLLKGGRTFQKLSHLAGEVLPKVLLERGDKSEKGDWYKNGLGVATFLLLYSSIAFVVRACVCLCVCVRVCVCGVKFVLLHFGSSVFWVYHTRFSSNTL